MLLALAFLKKHWLKFVIGAGVLAILLIGSIIYTRWTTPTLNQKETEQITDGIRQKNDQKIIDGLAASDARVAVGVEEVAKTDEEARRVEEAKRQTVKNYDGWTSEQLAAEAERRLQK